MQSLSHWDLKTVFVQRFLSEATFIPFFTLYLTIFHAKNFFIKSLKKKTKNRQFFRFSVVNTCLPQNIPATPHKFKKKFPPKGLEKGHNGNNPNLSVRK